MSVLQTIPGSNRITVEIRNHGALKNDTVKISDVQNDVGGIPASEINADHVIVAVEANTFEIQVKTKAMALDGYDGVIGFIFDIRAGVATGVFGYGWDAGSWGRRGYGQGWLQAVIQPPRLYTQDRFNDDLIFCIRNGDIFYWQYDNTFSSRSIPISLFPGASDVPQIVGSILFSQQDRHLFAFGCTEFGTNNYDPLAIRWASQDAPEFWTPGTVLVPSTGQISSAGFSRVTNGSEIIRAMRSRGEILVFTDSALYSIQFIGDAEVFSAPQELSDNISIISPNSVTTVNGLTYWMGTDKFYIYNGRVETLPCTLKTFIFDDINRSAQFQVCCGTNERFNEIIWFYPSKNSEEVDRYVIFNYQENIWYYGTMGRTAWLDSPMREYPQAAFNGALFDHERGSNDDTLPMKSFISSSDIDIEDGDRFMFVHRMLPDINFEGTTASNASVKMSVLPKAFPGNDTDTNNTEENGLGRDVNVAEVDQYTEQVFVRLRGRQIRYKVESEALDVKWQLGATRLDVRPDGRRR